jgi:hypothetical protein
MASEAGERAEIPPVVEAVLAAPTDSARRLPQLLRLLDAETPLDRLYGAWAVCLVAESCPETVEPITRRLVDRLGSNPSETRIRLTTELSFRYLREQFPDTVVEVLMEVAKEAEEEAKRRRYLEMSHGFARSDYFGQNDNSRDVGRTRLPTEGASDRRRIYQEEGYEIGGPPADAEGVPARTNADEGVRSEAEPGYPEGRGEASDPAERDRVRERQERARELERAEAEVRIADVVDASRFDYLQIVDTGVDTRYARTYRTRAVRGDTETAVALKTLTQSVDDRGQFLEDLGATLPDWQAIADHEFVTTLYDWALTPEPWIATQYTDQTLYDRIDMDLAEAAWNSLKIAQTLSYAHQRGVLHTGLDPYNVVYTDAVIADRKQPHISNFGLLDVLRRYVEPSRFLDPRYAAPEYFERRFGVIDHSTDIYQLGAVIYKALTGRHPFKGSYDEVRTKVLESTPPAPSTINPEIPAWLDEVVQKAMARQKLTRYESATHIVSELSQLSEDV